MQELIGIFFPAILGDYQQVADSEIKITSIYLTLTLGLLPFNQVIEYDVGICNSEEHQHTIFKLAKHVGIIQKELLEDDKVWTLIEYHIIQ